jgi:hypothetical protein
LSNGIVLVFRFHKNNDTVALSSKDLFPMTPEPGRHSTSLLQVMTHL